MRFVKTKQQCVRAVKTISEICENKITMGESSENNERAARAIHETGENHKIIH